MKKVVGILMVMVMVFVAYSAMAEAIVHNTNGWDATELLEQWIIGQKGESYQKDSLDSNGYFRGYGVLDVDEFENQYGVSATFENFKEIMKGEYKGLELEIELCGFCEGYDVYVMKAKADEPIGRCYQNGDYVSYYEGEMIFMMFSNK